MPKVMHCAVFNSNGDLFAGGSNGNIYIWRRDCNVVDNVIEGAHSSLIHSICIAENGDLLTGGGKDQSLVTWEMDAVLKEKGMSVRMHIRPFQMVF